MSKAIDFDLQKYDGEFLAAGAARVTRAAIAIRDAAKRHCVKGTITRPPRKHFVLNGHLEPESPNSSARLWTERTPGAMRNTIRVVHKFEHGDMKYSNIWVSVGAPKAWDVRVYAGNFATWWALQMEYGFGGWKGGAKPFLRPALHESESKVRDILEGR
jgi:hypothetical protein